MAKKLAVTIIGGGVSGMTAALILARFGHDVTLVERAPTLGTTIRGFFRGDYYFDTGLHYTGGLGKDRPFPRYLDFLGLGDLPFVEYEPDGFDTVRFAPLGKDLRLAVGYHDMKERLLSLFPGEEKGLDAYFYAVRNVYGSAPFLHEATDIKEAFAETFKYDTLEAFLRENIQSPVLRATLSLPTLTHGAQPSETSFLQHARVVASVFDSVGTVTGGGLALAEAFERRLAECGVRVITGNGVARVNLSPAGAVEGVTLDDGGMFDTDAVVYTGHPYYLIKIVGEGVFTTIFTRHLLTLAETPSAYMMFGVSDTPLLPDNGSNLLYCPDTDFSNFYRPRSDLSNGPYLLMTRPGTGVPEADASGRATGEGRSVLALVVGNIADFAKWKETRSGERGTDYEAYKARKLEQFREGLIKTCPEAASVRFIEGATPLTLRDHIHSLQGSIYGRKHTMQQNNPQPATRVPGLWLAGQSIVSPGILGAVISSFLACGYIVGPEALYDELKRDRA